MLDKFSFSIKIKKIYIEKNVNTQYNRDGCYCPQKHIKKENEDHVRENEGNHCRAAEC